MRAVILDEYHENVIDSIRCLKVAERPVGVPRHGQVLVRIERAPCNPSDLLLLQGRYGTLKKLPTVPGWEGAGTVVASGGGLFARWLKGKRVACALKSDRDGTWAEYFVANATDCIPLRREITFDQGASLIVNPMTAIGLLQIARAKGHRAAVHTAGASQLGRMLIAMAADANYPLVNVVRCDEHVEMLKTRGAKYVLNSSREGFAEELKSLCEQLGATAAFEAVAGDFTGIVLNAMPRGATMYVYGGLSQEPCGNIDPIDLVFLGKTITGFFLGSWLKKIGPLRALLTARRVQQMLVEGRIETAVQKRVNLDQVVAGLTDYVNGMTAGKVLIMPHGAPWVHKNSVAVSNY
jgi:NADPH:quinone reductase-like Zn-dependent oxidoreductase